jgi:N-acetyltransferase 10
MGYGARALQALNAYYSGEYFNLDETAKVDVAYSDIATINEVCQKPRRHLPRKLTFH